MNAATFVAHRIAGEPVTVARGPHAGTRMLAVGTGWETDPVYRFRCNPSPDNFRAGLARYRPLFGDWVPFSALLSSVESLDSWQARTNAHRAAERQRESAREDAASALRRALKRRRLRGSVSVQDARVILRMSAADAYELAHDIEGRRVLLNRR